MKKIIISLIIFSVIVVGYVIISSDYSEETETKFINNDIVNVPSFYPLSDSNTFDQIVFSKNVKYGEDDREDFLYNDLYNRSLKEPNISHQLLINNQNKIITVVEGAFNYGLVVSNVKHDEQTYEINFTDLELVYETINEIKKVIQLDNNHYVLYEQIINQESLLDQGYYNAKLVYLDELFEVEREIQISQYFSEEPETIKFINFLQIGNSFYLAIEVEDTQDAKYDYIMNFDYSYGFLTRRIFFHQDIQNIYITNDRLFYSYTTEAQTILKDADDNTVEQMSNYVHIVDLILKDNDYYLLINERGNYRSQSFSLDMDNEEFYGLLIQYDDKYQYLDYEILNSDNQINYEGLILIDTLLYLYGYDKTYNRGFTSLLTVTNLERLNPNE